MALFSGGDRIFAAARVITERKRIEEALRESDENYRTLVERASEAIIILRKGPQVYANYRMAEFLGRPVSDIIRMDCPETVWPEDWEMIRTFNRDGSAGRTVPATCDFRLISAEGNSAGISREREHP